MAAARRGLLRRGALAGTKILGFSEGGTGESGRADALVKAAGLQDPAAERVLVRSSRAADAHAAAADVARRLGALREVAGGLACAIRVDATLVRGIALPAAVVLLGDGGRPARPRAWDHRSVTNPTAVRTDAR